MLLKKGSSGDDVKKLQQELGLPADGVFGPLTEAKVKEWQAANNLTTDGIVGDITWSKMFGSETPSSDSVPSSDFKLEKLKGHIPDSVIVQIPDTAEKFNITTPLRLAHFLAQCSHESGKFKWVVEFASGDAYEGRKDLGNTEPGDGPRFKGRGYIQLTGRANYTAFSKFCGDDCVAKPDLVATKYPMMSAAFYFEKNGLWKVCDKGATEDDVKAVTKLVNGGYNGLDERQSFFTEFWALLE